MDIEIVDIPLVIPMKNGDFPELCGCLQEGMFDMFGETGWSSKKKTGAQL